jgi:hypothetical protein
MPLLVGWIREAAGERRGSGEFRPKSPSAWARGPGFPRSAVPSDVQTEDHRELPCWLRPRQHRGPLGLDRGLDGPADLQSAARRGSRSEERRVEPKFRRRIIASCLVGCAQGSIGALWDWIEGWMIQQPVARSGWRSERRRTEPSSDVSPSRAALLAAPKAASETARIESWMIQQAVARIGWRSEERRTEPSSDGSPSRAALLAAPKAASETPRIESWMILQGRCRIGCRSEERRTEPKFRRRIIASCLVGCAQGSVRRASDRNLDQKPSGRSRS